MKLTPTERAIISDLIFIFLNSLNIKETSVKKKKKIPLFKVHLTPTLAAGLWEDHTIFLPTIKSLFADSL